MLKSKHMPRQAAVINALQRAVISFALVFALVFAVTTAACGGVPETRSGRQPGGASLSEADSIQLQESDSAYVGRPVGIAGSRRVGYFVSDGFARRVLWYRPDGSLGAVIGRQGDGPGELQAPTELNLVGDSILQIADAGHQQVLEWQLREKRFRGDPRRISGLPPTFSAGGGGAFGSATNLSTGTRFFRLPPHGDSIAYFGPIDAPLRRSLVWAYFSRTPIDVWGDTLGFMSGPSDHLVLAGLDGVPRDSIPLPKRQRRGVPRDVNEMIARRTPILTFSAVASLPLSLHRLSDGRTLVAYLDGAWKDGRAYGVVYVTTLDRDAKPICVDAVIGSMSDAPPRISFDGDTLLALQQTVVGDKAVATVRRFALPRVSCGE